MPKSRVSSRSKPIPEEQERAGDPPGQAEVERAIGRILERLKPKGPKLDRTTSRASVR